MSSKGSAYPESPGACRDSPPCHVQFNKVCTNCFKMIGSVSLVGLPGLIARGHLQTELQRVADSFDESEEAPLFTRAYLHHPRHYLSGTLTDLLCDIASHTAGSIWCSILPTMLHTHQFLKCCVPEGNAFPFLTHREQPSTLPTPTPIQTACLTEEPSQTGSVIVLAPSNKCIFLLAHGRMQAWHNSGTPLRALVHQAKQQVPVAHMPTYTYEPHWKCILECACRTFTAHGNSKSAAQEDATL